MKVLIADPDWHFSQRVIRFLESRAHLVVYEGAVDGGPGAGPAVAAGFGDPGVGAGRGRGSDGGVVLAESRARRCC